MGWSTDLRNLTVSDLKVLEDTFPNLEHLTISWFGLSVDFIEALKNSTLLENIVTIDFENSCLAPNTTFEDVIKSTKLSKLKFLSLPWADQITDLERSIHALTESNLKNLEELAFVEDRRLVKGLVQVLTHAHPLDNLREIYMECDSSDEIFSFEEKMLLLHSPYSLNKPYLSNFFKQ